MTYFFTKMELKYPIKLAKVLLCDREDKFAIILK